jgi:hypothetical protein
MPSGFRPLAVGREDSGNLHERRCGPLEVEIDLWDEVRRLLPLLEACEEIELRELDDQNGAEACRPV